MKKCCFAGHSEIYNKDSLFDIVKKKAEELIIQKGVNEFWVGNYGAFDYLAASAVRELKKIFRYNTCVSYSVSDKGIKRV